MNQTVKNMKTRITYSLSGRSRPLDVIVPIYRNAALTRTCLASLIDHVDEIEDLDPRLLLINDSPDDEEIAALLKEPWLGTGTVQIFTNEANLGFVRSVNRALEVSLREGRDALLVNSDTKTFLGTLRNLLAAVRSDPQVAFASPRSNNAALCSLPHFHGGVASDPCAAFQRWRALSASMPSWHFAPTAVGFYMYIRHDVLADHGLLAEEFGKGYEEENDLVMRARKVGKRAVIVNSSFAYHAGGASFSLAESSRVDARKQTNHALITRLHPEFMPLVKRYERSAHFRAERLLAGLLPDDYGRISVAFDLTGLGEHYNGTNEHTVAVLKALAQAWRHKYRISAVATAQSFRFHGLDLVDGLYRVEPDAPGVHAVAIRIAQPFTMEQVSRIEGLAPTCIYAMLDTIAEDCGPIYAQSDVTPLWDHVAAHSNGLIFISEFSESTFRARHPVSQEVHSRVQLLSTDVNDYKELDEPSNEARSHVLILGNHFPHKGVTEAVEMLRKGFPQLSFVAISDQTRQEGNLITYQSGSIDRLTMRRLYRAASVVVLPSYVEGFGMGLMHALANRKPVVARRIPPTMEVLNGFEEVTGVELFDTNADIVAALSRALITAESRVKGKAATDWASWASALAGLIDAAISDADLFPRLKRRLEASDALGVLLKAADLDTSRAAAVPAETRLPVPIDELLGLEGDAFIDAAYTTLLRRAPDEDGLRVYRQELAAAGGKLGLLAAICASEEGREKASPQLVAEINSKRTAAGQGGGAAVGDTGAPQTPAAPRLAFDLEAWGRLGGVQFVETAYRFVLGREPDEAGMQTYLKILGRGGNRVDVLFALYDSIEARALAKRIPELDAIRDKRARESRRLNWRAMIGR
jgi:GT2 family glycosyltransferase